MKKQAEGYFYAKKKIVSFRGKIRIKPWQERRSLGTILTQRFLMDWRMKTLNIKRYEIYYAEIAVDQVKPRRNIDSRTTILTHRVHKKIQ